mgnify:CR=1 FL=1
MDFNKFQNQKISQAIRFGIDLDFYCKFSIKKVAQKFSEAVDAKVIIVPDDDGFIPEQGKFYIKEGYGFGSERYSFVSAPLPNTYARALIWSGLARLNFLHDYAKKNYGDSAQFLKWRNAFEKNNII